MKKRFHDMISGIVRANTVKIANNVFAQLRKVLVSEFNHKALYTVDLRRVQYSITSSLIKHFNLSQKAVEYMSTSAGLDISFNDAAASCGYDTSRIWNKNTMAMTIYKDTPIILICGYKVEDIAVPRNNPSDDEKYGCCDQGYRDNSVMLMTIKTEKNIVNMKRFISMMIKESVAADSECLRSRLYISGYRSRSYQKYRFRTFNDTFIPDTDMSAITNALDRFKTQRHWYEKNNIPYHFGILLYGKPASGKTSVAQAIADYMKSPLYMVSGDSIYRLPDMLGMEIPEDTMSPDIYTIVVVEDIDCGFADPEPDTCDDVSDNNFRFTPRNRKVGLATVLNSIDGMCAPKNTIFIFTTNHIEKLDPALIRPGRIDLKIEINGITNETFGKFCKFHYGEAPKDDININTELTFADLQLEVMKGSTMDELIEFVRKE